MREQEEKGRSSCGYAQVAPLHVRRFAGRQALPNKKTRTSSIVARGQAPIGGRLADQFKQSLLAIVRVFQ